MYVGWRDLRRAKGRFALIGAVVVLITILVGLLSGLTRGLGEQSTSAISGLVGERIAVKGDSFNMSVMDAKGPGVPLGIATTRATGPQGSSAVAVIGLDDATVAPDSQGMQANSVVMSKEARAALGDSLTIGGTKLKVAATRGDASFAHTPVVWTTLETWQKLTRSPGKATAHVLSAQDSVPAGARAVSMGDAKDLVPGYSAENGSLVMIRGALLLISALVVGAFFTVWTQQRTADVAVLLALGARPGVVLRDALGQALLVLGITGALGAAVVALLGQLVGSAVPFSMTLFTLLGPIALLVALGLLGAALAVRRVTRIDPLMALQGGNR